MKLLQLAHYVSLFLLTSILTLACLLVQSCLGELNCRMKTYVNIRSLKKTSLCALSWQVWSRVLYLQKAGT